MFEKVIYIASDCRSGSTLLDLLLGNHDKITSVGELWRLEECLNNPKSHCHICMCGKSIKECPFWEKVEYMLGVPLGKIKTKCHEKLIDRRLEQVIMLLNHKLFIFCSYFLNSFKHDMECAVNMFRLYDAISKVNKTPFIVDSSKVAYYFRLLYLLQPEKVKIIFLYRDGRGVTYSKMREEGMKLEKAAKGWVKSNRMMEIMKLGIPKNKIFTIKYEDLCKQPSKVLEKICHFIGIGFQKKMTRLDKCGKHIIGGNPMKFKKEDDRIILDESWKYSMTEKDLKIFEQIAGKINKKIGYWD